MTDRFEPGYVVTARRFFVAAHISDLFAGFLLPFLMKSEQQQRPSEKVRGGFLPGEVERLAFVNDIVNTHLVVLVRRYQQAEEIFRDFAGVLFVLNNPAQGFSNLLVQLPSSQVVPRRNESKEKDLRARSSNED